MEVREFLVLEEEEDTRLDLFLSEQMGDMSRSYIQKLIKEDKVIVNGRHEKSKYLVKEEDKIEISIPEPTLVDIVPMDIPIEIIYEDSELLVVNKPKGMVVHPAPGNYDNTLVNALMYHCEGKLSSINGIIRPGIVHRIDKDTSGLLMVAKNNNAHNYLADQLKEHSITRRYEMICHGKIKEEKFSVDAPIARNPKDRLKMGIVAGGKRAVTHFEVLKELKEYTYLQAELETGRTHQIRVHMAYKKHPLLGDPLYGPQKSKVKVDGQVLHAKVLGFIHPVTKEYMEFTSELPDYFKKLLSILE